MNARLPKSAAILLAFGLILGPGLTACEEEGPAERAGEQVDDAAEETREKVDDATEGNEPPAQQ